MRSLTTNRGLRKKMGGTMDSVFGKPYLEEEDWWID